MRKLVTVTLAVAMLCCLAPAASLALEYYGTDFESYAMPSEGALMGDGWLVYGNVFGFDWGLWWSHGPWPAPNDGIGWCAIVAGEGLGAQCMSVYSDYGNGDQPNGIVQSLIFREQTITAGDVGETWIFSFKAKLGNLAGGTTAAGFIKTIDPNNGWAQTNFITLDTTTIPSSWGEYQIPIVIDAGLAGQILQFGFLNNVHNYEPSGVFYDDVALYTNDPIDNEDGSWGEVKSLFR